MKMADKHQDNMNFSLRNKVYIREFGMWSKWQSILQQFKPFGWFTVYQSYIFLQTQRENVAESQFCSSLVLD